MTMSGTSLNTDLRDRLGYYREENRHEFNLLGQRMTWFVACQAFLITALAITASNSNDSFRLTYGTALCIIGAFTSGLAWLGILAACAVIRKWLKLEEELFEGFPDGDELKRYCVERPPLSVGFGGWQRKADLIHWVSLLFVHIAPAGFILFWVWAWFCIPK